MGSNMIYNQRIVNARLRHCNHLVHCNRTDGHRTAQLLFDHCPIPCFNLVHALPDGRSGQRAHARANDGPTGRVTNRVAHNRPHAGAQQTSSQRPLVGMIGRATGRSAGQQQQRQKK